MNIALVGYGKMGHAIERIALERGHNIVCRIDVDNIHDISSEAFAKADVAIEFTTPATAVDNYRRIFATGVPVVSGTTGWTDRLSEVSQMVEAADATLLWASNFSIGVNLFRRINRYAASLFSKFGQYVPEMVEVHHVHKLDHPSGTAITLANDLMSAHPALTGWYEPENIDDRCPGLLPINHERRGEVPGIHTVQWTSDVDTITLTHSAKSRDGFALGAVMAAEWIVANPNRRGMLSIDDMLQTILND